MVDAPGSMNVVRRGVTEAAHLGDERTTVMGALQRLRDLVPWKVRDASDETLRSARTASGLTIPGVIRLIHLVQETARHLGHLDLLRELADGQVGEKPK